MADRLVTVLNIHGGRAGPISQLKREEFSFFWLGEWGIEADSYRPRSTDRVRDPDPRTGAWRREAGHLDRFRIDALSAQYRDRTSKWNKIEHRLFSYVAMNWRGKPLMSLAVIIRLIGSTATEAGLRVRSEIDEKRYPKGVAQMESIKPDVVYLMATIVTDIGTLSLSSNIAKS